MSLGSVKDLPEFLKEDPYGEEIFRSLQKMCKILNSKIL